MANLLRAVLDAVIRGPRVGRTPQAEVRDWDSVAEILALARGPRLYSGVPVDDEQAMRLGAVWACVNLLAEMVSTLPVDEFRRVQAGPPRALPSSSLLVDPAGDGSGFEVWAHQLMVSLLLRGNGYGLVTDLDSEVRPRHIMVLHPDRVSVRRERNFGPVTWSLDNNPIELFPDGPLWHVAGYPIPGTPVGASPIRYAAETIGLGIATRKFGAQWFGDGAHPTGTLERESDEPITEEQAKTLKQRVQSALHDNREPLVLGGGWKLNPWQIHPEESQFLETSQANVADVARYFRVPPEMIGGKAADSLTYANQEQRAIAFLTYTLNPWLVRVEQALSRLRPRGTFVKFNTGALLRTDLKTRYEAHVLAIRGGFGTPNERRLLEDLPPLPDADQLLWPPYATSEGGGEMEQGVPA